jgi:hypothetical protein
MRILGHGAEHRARQPLAGTVVRHPANVEREHLAPARSTSRDELVLHPQRTPPRNVELVDGLEQLESVPLTRDDDPIALFARRRERLAVPAIDLQDADEADGAAMQARWERAVTQRADAAP